MVAADPYLIHALRRDHHVKTPSNQASTIVHFMYPSSAFNTSESPTPPQSTDFSDGGTNILDVTLLNSAPARRRRKTSESAQKGMMQETDKMIWLRR
jgi:hypothetical protein